MIIGFFHIGQPEHGVCRYGRLLATEAKKRRELAVHEYEVILTGQPLYDLLLIKKAAQSLSTSHIVHFQFTENIWGTDDARWLNVWTFLRYCRCPKAVTVHDTESTGEGGTTNVSDFKRTSSAWRMLKRHSKILLMKAGLSHYFTLSNQWIRSWLIQEVQLAFVCTHEEFRRLGRLPSSERVMIIPHFIENRHVTISRATARQKLELDAFQVVTLLGFIYGGKGYEVLIHSLGLLPKTVKAVFAGGACQEDEGYVVHLQEMIQTLGVSSRVRITGYLAEPELEQYLMATDVAVCPYQVCYASGSLSTWLSCGVPVLASDLPQFREYHYIEAGAICLFSPHTPEALAEGIRNMLSASNENACKSAVRLRERFSIHHIFDCHLAAYQKVCRS